jgi:putative tryptophan/tyrosine transport system permease protein
MPSPLSSAVVDSLEAGLVWGCVALGVYLTFRVLAFADLTVEGSFPLGAAVAAALIFRGGDPFLATGLAVLAGMGAGALTGLLHTRRGINDILAGILVATALYSVILVVMDRPNTPLLGATTVYERVYALLGVRPSVWPRIGLLALICGTLALALNWLLHTDFGLALRATGSNPGMARALGIHTDNLQVVGLMLANGLVALSGALVAQIQGFADVGMGVGTLVAGLAAIVIAEALFGAQRMIWCLLAVLVGSFAYRLIVAGALLLGLPATLLKLITAVLVVATLEVSLPALRQRLVAAAGRGAAERPAPVAEPVDRVAP